MDVKPAYSEYSVPCIISSQSCDMFGFMHRFRLFLGQCAWDYFKTKAGSNDSVTPFQQILQSNFLIFNVCDVKVFFPNFVVAKMNHSSADVEYFAEISESMVRILAPFLNFIYPNG